MLGTFKMIWDWLYSFFGWNRHAIYNWNHLRMSRKGSLGGALLSFCAYVPKCTLMMYTFFHRDNGTRNLTSVILLKSRPKLPPKDGTRFFEISKISQGSVPGEQNLNTFLAPLLFLKSWIPLKFYMKNLFHAYYFIKVAVRPKRVGDFSSLMTFYG